MDLIDEKVKKAIKEGAFDDLPGKGKPLHFEDSALHNEYWLVNKILKNANYLPPWLELDKKVRESKAQIEILLEEHARWLTEKRELLDKAQTRERFEMVERVRKVHEQQKRRFQELVQGINPRLREMNREAPVSRFQKRLIDEGEWLGRFGHCENLYMDILRQPLVQENDQEKSWFGKVRDWLCTVLYK